MYNGVLMWYVYVAVKDSVGEKEKRRGNRLAKHRMRSTNRIQKCIMDDSSL